MDGPTKSRRSPTKLSTLFNHAFPSADEGAVVLREYRVYGRRADRDALFEMYAPWVQVLCARLKKRRPDFYRDDLDVMVSDGCLGLLVAIDKYDGITSSFPSLSADIIIRFVRRGRIVANGGEGRHRRNCQIAAARGDLVQRLGRVPLADELAERLRDVITNPGIHIHRESLVPLYRKDGSPFDVADKDEPGALQEIMGSEAMRVALAGLEKKDRQIFKLLLKGVSDVEIARKLGVSRQRIGQRLNGVLWLARSNARLAECLGVEAEQPPKLAKGEYLQSPAKYPPARLAVG